MTKRMLRNWGTFTPGGAGAGTLVIPTDEVATLQLHRLLLIVNATTNEIILNTADSTKGGSVSGTTLTFDAATNGSGAAAGDKLQIWYDSPGAKKKQVVCAASVNATLVKGYPGTVTGIQVSNYGAEVAFLKLYNKATTPTISGTPDTPYLTFIIPVSAAGAGNNIPIGEAGIDFDTGIGLGTTLTPTDAGIGALTAADKIVVTVEYD